MKTYEYNEYEKKEQILEMLAQCEWGPGKFLNELLAKHTLDATLGEHSLAFFLMDEEKVVSFATLSKQDCVDDELLFPWIGFVYTKPEYRGHRYSEKVIQKAIEEAKKQGYHEAYLATDHIGFYEKYGFVYLENRLDRYKEDSRIYKITF